MAIQTITQPHDQALNQPILQQEGFLGRHRVAILGFAIGGIILATLVFSGGIGSLSALDVANKIAVIAYGAIGGAIVGSLCDIYRHSKHKKPEIQPLPPIVLTEEKKTRTSARTKQSESKKSWIARHPIVSTVGGVAILCAVSYCLYKYFGGTPVPPQETPPTTPTHTENSISAQSNAPDNSASQPVRAFQATRSVFRDLPEESICQEGYISQESSEHFRQEPKPIYQEAVLTQWQIARKSTSSPPPPLETPSEALKQNVEARKQNMEALKQNIALKQKIEALKQSKVQRPPSPTTSHHQNSPSPSSEPNIMQMATQKVCGVWPWFQ